MKYIYFEVSTQNLPGYNSGIFMYNLVIKLLRIAKLKASNAEQILRIVRETKKEYLSIIRSINATKIPRRDKDGKIIYKRDSKTKQMVPVMDTITFNFIAAKNLVQNLFERLLPTFLVFFREIENRGYIKDASLAQFVKISGDLDQMYKMPGNETLFQKLETHFNFNISNVYDRDIILKTEESADDAVYLVQQLFDRKSSKGLEQDKKLYNETLRVFKKLQEIFNQIKEKEGKINEYILSQDEDDLIADDADLIKIPSTEKLIKREHPSRKHNFELPNFAKAFTRDLKTGSLAYRRPVDRRKKSLVEIGAEKGIDTSSFKEQRKYFGYTKVFNGVMNRILKDKKEGILRKISSEDKRDLQSYFSGRKPFVVRKEFVDSPTEISWYDALDPYNQSVWFFRGPEVDLLQEITRASYVARGDYDVDLIYEDFIYLLRLFLNGNVKNRSGEIVEIEQGAFNDSRIIINLVNQYMKEGDLFIRGETSKAERITKTVAAKKRSEERQKKKETGEIEMTKSDLAKHERGVRDLEDELETLDNAEGDLLYDILSAEKIEEDPDLYKKELEDLINFAETNTRIIEIGKCKNLLAPKITPKPSNDLETKKIISRILNKETSEVNDEDMEIAKKIFAQDSNSFFNRKAFLVDYIDLLKGREIKVKSGSEDIHITEPIDIPKDLNNKKSIENFLKKVIKKSTAYTTDEIEAAKNALSSVDDNVIDKGFFKKIYFILLKQKNAKLELERIQKLKSLEGKEIPISDIMSPLSSNKYSNRLYLKITDLSKEIKFSDKVSGLVMILKPKNEKDIKSEGEFIISVSRKYFDDFIKLNEYLINQKNKNPKIADKLILESEDLYVSDSIPILRGYYTSKFISSNLTTAEGDPYDLKAGYFRSASTKKDIFSDKKSLDDLIEKLGKTRAEQIRVRRELLSMARKKSIKMQRRIDFLSGKKVKEKISDRFLERSKELIESFKEMQEKLSFEVDLKEIESALSDYYSLINMEEELAGSKKIKKAASKIKDMFYNIYSLMSDKRKKLLSNQLNSISKILFDKKINFLKLVFDKPNPPKIVFDSNIYDGSYTNSYDDITSTFNKLIKDYLKFKFTEQDENKKNITLIRVKEIREKNIIFISLIKSTSELINLISTPEIEEQFGSRSSRGLRLETDMNSLENKIIPIKKTLLIQESGSKYKKIKMVETSKIGILNEVLKSNEIK